MQWAIGGGTKRRLPAAAALNWVMKDGLDRLGKLLFAASLGRTFDSNLKFECRLGDDNTSVSSAFSDPSNPRQRFEVHQLSCLQRYNQPCIGALHWGTILRIFLLRARHKQWLPTI